MQLDWLGLLVMTIPLAFLLFGRTILFAQAVIVSLVFGSLSVIGGSALGGASLTVPLLADAMLVIPFVGRWFDATGEAAAALVHTFAWLLVFLLWAIIMAYFGPRLFAGAMNVTAMRPLVIHNIYLQQALGPTSSNFTTSIYLAVGVAAALATCALAVRPDGACRLQNAFLLLGAVHAGFGVIDLLAYLAGQPTFLDIVRTASYAQLSNEFFGFKRLAGSFSEASAYAGFGFPLLIFAGEGWWYGVNRWAGAVALGLLIMLLASTSTTAYVSIAAYAACFALRAVIGATQPEQQGRSLATAILFLAGGGAVLAVLLFFPAVANNVGAMLERVTTGKLDTDSAAVRGSWAAQGTQAFVISYGLGIGPGSFRSSGMLQALVGSVGVGTLFYALYLVSLARQAVPPRPAGSFDVRPAVHAVLLGLMPALLAGASADPGLLYGPLAGLALARRYAQALGLPPPSRHREST